MIDVPSGGANESLNGKYRNGVANDCICRENARITMVFSCTMEWLGGSFIASTIHHLADNCDARARWCIHRDPFRLQLCVLGPLRCLCFARGQKIARRLGRGVVSRVASLN